MANKTIYGCINTSTGVITFEGEACDSGNYTGCIETSGVKEGMIKVIISETTCDDTYYGCINTTTGKFQLTIPDDCCCGCETIEGDFSGTCCWAEDQTPLYVIATISGMVPCSGEDPDVNGVYCLEMVFTGEYPDCFYTWEGIVDGVEVSVSFMAWHPFNASWVTAGPHTGNSFYSGDDAYSNCTMSFSNICSAGGCSDPESGCGLGEVGFGYGGTLIITNPCD